jgi:PAS domain S-box-containing protein
MGQSRGQTAESGMQAILESITDGVFTVDLDWRITFFNRAAERIVGIPREEALGKPCCEVFQAEICGASCALRQTMVTGDPVVGKAVYVRRPDGNRMPISISTALLRDETGAVVGGAETFRDLSLVDELRKQLHKSYTFADIVSKSHRMRETLSLLPLVAASDSTVLITGESGTGKELVARAIHSLSARAKRPFVAVNCGALPETLLESELFGHTAGAFTDAKRDRQGRFGRAESGTIFLDEVGDVSPALQVRLLRVLQEREYEPIGASKPVKAQARVICATNQDLDALMRNGAFRRDLYYRVNVVQVPLPPLRQRKDDIPLLVRHFIGRLNDLQGKEIVGVSTEAMSALMAHHWPGNVRELENALEHAFVLCPGDLIELPHLPASFRPEGGARPGAYGTLADLERRTIVEALRRNDGRKLATACQLGIHKTTLWRKLKNYGITGT